MVLPGHALYQVVVDSNYHYQDESDRRTLGNFPTCEAAMLACRRIVDDFLEGGYRAGMTADELWQVYAGFGEDPFIIAQGAALCTFSAWDYARARCHILCDMASNG